MAEESSIDWEKIRKPLYGISLAVGIGGIFLSWILTLIVYSAVDNLQIAGNEQIDAISNTILQIEESTKSMQNELDTTGNTADELEKSLNDLSDALDDSADASIELGNGLSAINLGVFSLKTYGGSFIETGNKLKTSSASMENAAKTITEHKTNIADMKTKIDLVAASIANQREKLDALKISISNLLSNIKLAILLGMLMVDAAFLILGINSIAGLIEKGK